MLLYIARSYGQRMVQVSLFLLLILWFMGGICGKSLLTGLLVSEYIRTLCFS